MISRLLIFIFYSLLSTSILTEAQALKEAKGQKEVAPPETLTLAEPGKIVDVELPFESRLNIQGRKMVRSRLGGAHYTGRKIEEGKETPPSSLTKGLKIDQELQARIHGIVKQKIHVNIDYDDTQKAKQQKFWIAYKGDPEEIIQDAAFGDLQLSLPTTEFVAYNKSLFGAKVDLKLANLRLMALGSRTKGITETKEFKGKAIQQIKDINDTSFRQRKYYQLLAEIPKEERKALLPISSLEVYIDDKNVANDTLSTIELVAKSHDLVDAYQGKFDLQNPVSDYVVNYQTGIITFRKDIATNYVIAVRFKDKTGTWHPAKDYLMIKPDYTGFPSLSEERKRKYYDIYELKGYYSLGHTNIDLTDPNFLIEIRNLNRENKDNKSNKTYLWIFGLDRNDDGRIDPAYIDTELGLISLPANTPFDLRLENHPTPGDNPGYIDNEEDSSYREIIDRTYSASEQMALSNTTLYTTSPQIKYQIHIEYKTQIKEYFLRPFIVETSENVYINGVKMRRNIDYLIDYESGWITFIGTIKIDEETTIKVDYEYIPFGGQFQKNLLGVRAEYKPGDNFHIGSTYVYEGATVSQDVPKIGQTPESLKILDVDTKVKFLSIMKRLFNFNIPLELDLTAEVAKSWRNPNLFGKAMVESMEGVETKYSIPIDSKAWALGSFHKGILKYRDEPYTNRAGPYNEEEGHLVDSKVKAKEKSLVLKYELSPGEIVAIVSSLSKTVLDFSGYNFLEVWTKGVRSETIYIDLGIINEDADGDGILDTEDKNGDGLLNPGEDVGWEFNGSITTRVGVGNNQLDSEDLDGDGRLNSSLPTFVESYFRLKLEDKWRIDKYPENVESGWVLYSLPLKEAIPVGEFGAESWNLIKHIRIRIEAIGSGQILIDHIAVCGTKWEKGEVRAEGGNSPSPESYFIVTTKNSEDDPDYKDLKDDPEFKDLYRGKDLRNYKEEALVLDYKLSMGEIGSTRYIYTQPRDYSKYKTLRLWVFGDGSGGEFFIKFGSDNTNYFGQKFKINFEGWKLFEIDLKRSVEEWRAWGEYGYKGTPFMSNIKYLQLGIHNNSKGELSGSIWVNEIHLAGVEMNEGQAHRVKFDTSWSDWLSFGWGRKVLESDFESVGMTTPVQDTTIQDWYVQSSKIKWLPISYSGSRSKIQTDPEKVENIITPDLGTRYEEKHNYGIKFLQDRWPKITASFTTRDADITYQKQRRIEDEDSFTGEISHTLRVPFGHKFELSPGYKYIELNRMTTYPDDQSKNSLLLERTYDGTLDLRFLPVQTLITTSSLGMRDRVKREEVKGWTDEDFKLQSRNLVASLGLDYSAIKGVQPKLNTSANFDETYTYSHTPKVVAEKGVYSGADFKLLTKFIPKEWSPSLKFIDFDHTFRLEIKANYATLDGEEDTYQTLQKIYQDYYAGQLLKGKRPEGLEEISPKRTSASNTRTNSFGANLYLWDPLDASIRYSFKNQESQLQSSILYKDSRDCNFSIRFSLNEAFNLWKHLTISSYLLIKYHHSEEIIQDVSKEVLRSPSLTWQANWTQNFRTNLGIGFGQREGIRKEGVNLEETASPSLGLDYKITRPISIKFPFIKRRLRLEQELGTNFDFRAEFKQKIETGVSKICSSKYMAGLDFKYQIQKNLSAILGTKGEYFDDQLVEGKDYCAYEGSLELEFRF